MDANDIVSAVRGRVQSILTEGLRNYFNEARIAIESIEKEESIKINERDKLWIILKSLKDIPRKMAVELIRNSSLDNDDRAFLNVVCGDPELYVLIADKKTKEEVLGDELLISDKTLAGYKLSEHLPAQEDTAEDIDRYFLH